MKAIVRSPLAFIAGIGLFAFGAVHFVKLAVMPRLGSLKIPGLK